MQPEMTNEELKIAQAVAYSSDNSHCIAEITIPVIFGNELPDWAVIIINKLHLVKLFDRYSYYMACAKDQYGYFIAYTERTYSFEEAFSHINRRELVTAYELY